MCVVVCFVAFATTNIIIYSFLSEFAFDFTLAAELVTVHAFINYCAFDPEVQYIAIRWSRTLPPLLRPVEEQLTRTSRSTGLVSTNRRNAELQLLGGSRIPSSWGGTD